LLADNEPYIPARIDKLAFFVSPFLGKNTIPAPGSDPLHQLVLQVMYHNFLTCNGSISTANLSLSSQP